MRCWLKVVLGVVGLAVILAGLRRVRLEADILTTLPGELPEVQGLKLLRDAFEGGADLVIGVQAREETAAKQAVAALAQALRASPAVKRVRTDGTFEDGVQAGALVAWALQNIEPERLAATKARLEGERRHTWLAEVMEQLAESQEIAQVQRWAYDPLGLTDTLGDETMGALQEAGFQLASADGSFRLLFVEPAEPLTGYKEATAWLEGIRERVASPEVTAAAPDVTWYFTGEPAFLAETGSGIEKDMQGTIGLTEILITLLFWIMFRQLRPLLWIHLLLLGVMVLTLALAGWVLGSVSVMSLGFAAIVLGIVVDYAVLILQEARNHAGLTASALRRLAAPGITAGASTTAVVFLSLIFAGLPGMAHLGILVALGVLTGLVVMLMVMPHVVHHTRAVEPQEAALSPTRPRVAAVATVAIVVTVAGVLAWRGLPGYQTGPDALRPLKSSALAAWETVQQQLGRPQQAQVPVLVSAPLDELRRQAAVAETALRQAQREGLIAGFSLPGLLLPDPTAQQANRDVIEWFLSEEKSLAAAVQEAGFTEEALALFQHMLDAWRAALAGPWPQPLENSPAAEVLERFVTSGAKDGLPAVALGSVLLEGEPSRPSLEKLAALQAKLRALPFVHLAGWESLGLALSAVVKADLMRLLLPIIGVLAVMLALVFRNWRDVVLSFWLLALGLGALLATMALCGLAWNLASLAALPLLLGTGIDYGIHILLALRRTQNDLLLVRSTTARAVFFSGMTTVIGFSSLMAAGNQGIASLGAACCVGTGWILLLVLWLLPHWRAWLYGNFPKFH